MFMSGTGIRRTILVKLTLICGIFLTMATLYARAAGDSIEKLADDPACVRALAWIDTSSAWLTDQQIHLTEIPAPEFKEAPRGEYLKKIFEAAGLKVQLDKTGNVIAERPGSDANSVILLAAHLDTVFPAGTNVQVKRHGNRLTAPGVADNGEGNLRGIRALVETYGSRLAAVIAVDGASTEHITTQGIASHRFEIAITGPGGHSWSDFGAPNPITALSRGIVKFSALPVPDDPRSSYNFGIIEGGTSVNSIPSRAAVKVDLRSEDEAEVNKMERALRDAMQAGAREEMSAAHDENETLRVIVRSLGSRPAGKLPDNAPLLETLRSVDRFLGNRSRLERSSTDANTPLSLNTPAVSLGGGGKGGGSHTTAEWYDASGRELGLKRLFLATVALAGVQP